LRQFCRFASVAQEFEGAGHGTMERTSPEVISERIEELCATSGGRQEVCGSGGLATR
jgi:hypothetical protein